MKGAGVILPIFALCSATQVFSGNANKDIADQKNIIYKDVKQKVGSQRRFVQNPFSHPSEEFEYVNEMSEEALNPPAPSMRKISKVGQGGSNAAYRKHDVVNTASGPLAVKEGHDLVIRIRGGQKSPKMGRKIADPQNMRNSQGIPTSNQKNRDRVCRNRAHKLEDELNDIENDSELLQKLDEERKMIVKNEKERIIRERDELKKQLDARIADRNPNRNKSVFFDNGAMYMEPKLKTGDEVHKDMTNQIGDDKEDILNPLKNMGPANKESLDIEFIDEKEAALRNEIIRLETAARRINQDMEIDRRAKVAANEIYRRKNRKKSQDKVANPNFTLSKERVTEINGGGCSPRAFYLYEATANASNIENAKECMVFCRFGVPKPCLYMSYGGAHSGPYSGQCRCFAGMPHYEPVIVDDDTAGSAVLPEVIGSSYFGPLDDVLIVTTTVNTPELCAMYCDKISQKVVTSGALLWSFTGYIANNNCACLSKLVTDAIIVHHPPAALGLTIGVCPFIKY